MLLLTLWVLLSIPTFSVNWVLVDELKYEDHEILNTTQYDEYDFDDDTTIEIGADKNGDNDGEDYTLEKPAIQQLDDNLTIYFYVNVSEHRHSTPRYDFNNVRNKRASDPDITEPPPTIEDKSEMSIRISNTTQEPTEDYNYDKLKAQYDQEMEDDLLNKNSTEYIGPEMICDSDGFFALGVKTVICLIKQHKAARDEEERDKVVEKFYRIFKIWFGAILITFLICWCQFGYCDCCCPFRFCFPEDVIEETKQYLVMNPPGTITTETEKRYYKPSETERYLHDKLWNQVYDA